MFRRFKNVEESFRATRQLMLLIMTGWLLLCGLVAYKSYQLAALSQSKIYVLANGKAIEAFASERTENLPVEARDHVRVFHQHFFTLDPDEKVIRTNTLRALYLADASAKSQYQNLQESGYYAGIISGNISQKIHIDSIALNVQTYPYYFRCFATQQIIRTTSIVTRNLVTEGYLRDVSRSDHNPHGFLIEKWATLENRDIKIENR